MFWELPLVTSMESEDACASPQLRESHKALRTPTRVLFTKQVIDIIIIDA